MLPFVFRFLKKNWLSILILLILITVLIQFIAKNKQTDDINLKSRINAQDKEIEQLTEQINVLRESYRVNKSLSPTPTPLKYQPKKGEKYQIECFDYYSNSQKNQPEYKEKEIIMAKLEPGYNLSYLCDNPELKKTAVLSYSDKKPMSTQFNLQIYDQTNQKLTFLKKRTGNYLAGYCNEITEWRNNGDIYYKCGGGDGPWVTHGIIKINEETREEGITESCASIYYKTSCTQYCDNTFLCQSGFFCDLETNSCLQYCTKDEDCTMSSCIAHGPVMGCGRN